MFLESRERAKPEARDRCIDLDIGLVQLRVDGRFELVGELANASRASRRCVVRRPRRERATDARVAPESVVAAPTLCGYFRSRREPTRSAASRTTMPSTARMPLSIAASATTSACSYISAKQVIPPSSISAIARRAPSATSSVPSQRASTASTRSRARAERQIAREPAEQALRRVRVRVHESGQQHVPRSVVMCAGDESPIRLVDGEHRDDSAVVDRDRESLLDAHLRLDANGPAGTNQSVDTLHRTGCSSARERRASIAARMRANATGASGPVLNFALVFWALGCFRTGGAGRTNRGRRHRPQTLNLVVSFHRLSSRGARRGKGPFIRELS